MKKQPQEKSKSHFNNALLLFVISAALIGWGAYDTLNHREFMANADSTSGRVIKIHRNTVNEREDGKQIRTTYISADIEYMVKGKKYLHTTPDATTNIMQEGGTVTVYYNPSAPEEAKVDDGNGVNNKNKWIWICALVSLGAAIYFVFQYRKSKAS